MNDSVVKWSVVGGIAVWLAWAARGTSSKPYAPEMQPEKVKLPDYVQPSGSSIEEVRALMKVEGDRASFPCPDTRGPLTCHVRRQDTGVLNAYVSVPHSLVSRIVAMKGGDRFNAADTTRIGVHGGITYDGACASIGVKGERCVGFDTAHLGDFKPKRLQYNMPGDTYRDMEYVKKNIRKLAKAFLPGGEIYSGGEGVQGGYAPRSTRRKEFSSEERRARAYARMDARAEEDY